MPIAKWKQISEEEFRKLVKESKSIRELAIKIGYKPDGGGTIKSLKDAIKFYNCDVSHFLGQGWKKENYDYSEFTQFSNLKINNKAKVLIKLKGHKCENCQLEQWLSNPIPLQIHHINGIKSDNRIENLQLLCPNCHSQTDNFRRRNVKKVVSTQKETSDVNVG